MAVVTETRVTQTRRWRLGFESIETEQVEPVELPVEGIIPAELAGTLYRIGPARHDVYGDRNGSWFDGDGMAHSLRFSGGRVWYRNRFVQTTKKNDEDAARRRIYGGLGTASPVGGIQKLRRLASTASNPANTNIVAHGGELFALCEGGQPYRLDPHTLATIGADDLGVIPAGETYTAHAKHDPVTGEMWNIGFRFAPTARVSLYRRTTTGTTSVVARRPMPLNTIAHDWALTPTRAVIIASPLVMPRVPLGILSQRRTMLDLLRWKPQLGSRIMVIDRANGDVQHYRTEAFLLHHTANAFDDGDDTVVDLCAYPDASIFDLFRAPLAGVWPDVRHGCPERFRLTPRGEVGRRKLSDGALEFPRVAPRSWLAEHDRVFGVTGYLGQPVVLDTTTGEVTRLGDGPDEHAGELVPVPKLDAKSDDDVWLLTLVLGHQDMTQLRIFDGGSLGSGPVARVTLPRVMPFDFHGNWRPEHASATLP